ncbi:MAG: serine hydrolase domain-containing protein [Gemmatimonadales bacterium]
MSVRPLMRTPAAWAASLAGSVILAGCAGDVSIPAADAARMNRIVANLRPPVVVDGTTPTTYRLDDRLARHHVPGVSIAVVDSGRIVWAHGFGLKEAGAADSVTAATLFQAASISKPVTATAMLRLVEQGTLSLDEPANRYLTSWQVPENRFTALAPVTLRRIVSHSAGLTVHGFPGYAVTDSIPTVVQVLDGLKPANTAPVRVDTVPGAIWRYSGGGTTVMQLLLTDVTGEAFPALMQRLVLGPAGMTASGYDQPLPEARRGVESAAHGPTGAVIPGRWHVYPEMAAAGLWTTPTDLLKWAMAIAAARAGRDSSILSPRMATAMLTLQHGTSGLGPMLNGTGRSFRFGHGGANEGFRCDLVYFPETGQGAAVMSNGDNGSALVQEVMLAIAAEYGWPDYGPKKLTLISRPASEFAPFLGRFSITEPQAVTIEVSAEGDRMFIEAAGVMPRAEVGFVAADRVASLESGDELTFVTDRRGAVNAIRFAGYTFERDRR